MNIFYISSICIKIHAIECCPFFTTLTQNNYFSLSAEWVDPGEEWLLWLLVGQISSGMGGGGPTRLTGTGR